MERRKYTMKAIKQKLNSNDGASLIMVLALLLICVMVSSSILAVASSGSSRNKNRIETQRAYLAISSASDLLMEALSDCGTFAGNAIETHYGCQDCTIRATMDFFGEVVTGYRLDAELIPNPMDEGHLIIINGEHENGGVVKVVDDLYTSLNGSLASLILRAAGSVHSSGEVYEETLQLTVSSGGENDDRIPQVTVLFVMDRFYNIQMEVSAEGSELVVIISSDATANITVTEVPAFGCTHTVYYKEYQETGEFVDRKKDDWYIEGQKISTMTKVTWDTPVINKGVDIQ